MKNQWWKRFMRSGLQLFFLLTSVISGILGFIGGRTVSQTMQRYAEGKVVTLQAGGQVSANVTQPVEKMKTLFSDPGEATIDISYASGSENARVKVTAPADRLQDIALHIQTALGVQINVEQKQPFQGVHSQTGVKTTSSSSETNTKTAVAMLGTIEAVVGLVGTVLGLYGTWLTLRTAQFGLETALLTKEAGESKWRTQPLPTNKPPLADVQPQGKTALAVVLEWQDLPLLEAEPSEQKPIMHDQRFTIPPQAISDALQVIAERLMGRLPLTIRVFFVSTP